MILNHAIGISAKKMEPTIIISATALFNVRLVVFSVAITGPNSVSFIFNIVYIGINEERRTKLLLTVGKIIKRAYYIADIVFNSISNKCMQFFFFFNKQSGE